jgi:hypothetical protein
VAQQYVSKVGETYNSCEVPQPKPTAAEAKRAKVREAIAEDPRASERQIARQLGVDRDKVAAEAATAAETSAAASANDAGDPPSAPEPAGYSTPAAHAAAESVLEAARPARAAMTADDWRLLLAEIAAPR